MTKYTRVKYDSNMIQIHTCEYVSDYTKPNFIHDINILLQEHQPGFMTWIYGYISLFLPYKASCSFFLDGITYRVKSREFSLVYKME